MEKKLISLLLAVLMMFSALPITVFAAESEYPESEHPYGIGDFKWVYDGNPGTKSLSVTFSDKTEFHEYEYLSFYDQNGDCIGSAGNELAGKTVDFNATSLIIKLYSDETEDHYGFKITNIRENTYEVDGTVIPENCKITEDRATGTITFEPSITDPYDEYLSFNIFGSKAIKWVKKIVVKEGFKGLGNYDFNYFINAEILDFADDFYNNDFSYRGSVSAGDIDNTAFYKNKSSWDNESLYIGKKLLVLGENDTIKDGTTSIGCWAVADYYREDLIIPDSVIFIDDSIHYYVNSIYCSRGSYACSWAEDEGIDYTCIGDLKIKFKNCIISKGTPLSSAIEVYKLSSDYTWKQIFEYSSSGYSSSRVGAQTVTISDGEASFNFVIALSDSQNKYLNISDKKLYENLTNWDSADSNEDGVISLEEMKSYTSSIDLDGVSDISILEYADSAENITLYGYLGDIFDERLFAFQKYQDITSSEAKIPLEYFDVYGRVSGYSYFPNFDFSKEIAFKSSNESVAYFDGKHLNLVKPGNAVITLTFGSVSKSLNVHVISPDYYNDLGKTAAQVPTLVSANIINTPNGDVYKTTSIDIEKVDSGKNVLMSYFYPGRDCSSAYYITDDNTLWKSGEKLGDNFVKVGSSYALDKDGNCYDLLSFQLVASDVKDIEGAYYLTENGMLYKTYSDIFDDTNVYFVDKNVKSIIKNDAGYCYYEKNNNSTYVCDRYYRDTHQLFDHSVKDVSLIYTGSYYYTDESDNLWLSPNDSNGSSVKIASNVSQISNYSWMYKDCVYQTKNGDYYIHNGEISSYDDIDWNAFSTPVSKDIKKAENFFYLDSNNNLHATPGSMWANGAWALEVLSGDSYFPLNKIMTDVVDFEEGVYDNGRVRYYAIFTRTDGSVWSYTVGDEEPIKLLEGEDYTPEHTHTLNHITVPSTCKVAGMEYDICSECGETFNEKTLPLAAHTWGEWTVVKEATTTAEGQEKRTCSVCDKVETRAIEKLKVIKDDKTGIEINYNNEYDSDTEIKVEEQFSGKSFQLINTEFGKVNSKIYDIATYKDGVKVQPNGEITVKVPLPDGFTTNKVFVCYVDSTNGKVTKIPCEVKDGYVIFKTNHFSEYAIVEQSANVKSVSVSDITLNYKKSTTLKPTIKADEGAKYTVKYSSSNTKVATVDENGKVYAAKKGSATITCTVTDSNGNTVQDTCKVTVKYSFGQWLIKILLFGWIWY